MTTTRVKRVTSRKDLSTIAAADRICFQYDVPIEVSKAAWWVATVDDQWAGYAGAKWYWIEDEPTVYLCRAGVLPTFRGRGIQRELIKVRERWARKHGATSVVTDTVPSGVASMRSLISCGYLPYAPGAEWREAGAVYWRKILH